jgi:hypothetical protein
LRFNAIRLSGDDRNERDAIASFDQQRFVSLWHCLDIIFLIRGVMYFALESKVDQQIVNATLIRVVS